MNQYLILVLVLGSSTVPQTHANATSLIPVVYVYTIYDNVVKYSVVYWCEIFIATLYVLGEY